MTKIKYLILTLLIIIIGLVLAYRMFWENFELFGESEIEIIKTICDDEGIRQITVYEISGNAVSMPSIHVSVQMGCNGEINENEKVFFISEFYAKSDVNVKWKTFDKIELSYPKKPIPFKIDSIVDFKDKSLNLTIIYNQPDEILKFDIKDQNEKHIDGQTKKIQYSIEKIEKELKKEFVLNQKMIISGDFNADDEVDYATLIENIETKEKGIIIIHNSDKDDYKIIGAGNKINGENKNLNWIGVFRSIPKGKNIYPTLVDKKTGDIIGDDIENGFKLKGNGIFMHADESCGGGIIYWNGEKYNWMHIE